jgi:hypothetical protein
MYHLWRWKSQLVIKRRTNIFAYSETWTRVLLTVPSIGEERVFTVAKPELKVAVVISGIFSFIN